MDKREKVFERPIFWILLLFLAITVFITLSSFRISQIITEDDLTFLTGAKTWHETGAPLTAGAAGPQPFYHHPYLYVYVIKIMMSLLGPNDVVARFPGILCGVVSIILTFFIVKSCCPGEDYARVRLATITSGLYALAPTTIQGTTMIQADTSILVPATLLLFLSTIRYFQTKRYMWLVMISCALAVSFWARLSAPTILTFALVTYLLLSKGDVKVKLTLVLALISGALLFLATWYFYCRIKGAPFLRPFMYTFYYLIEASANKSAGGSQLFSNVIHLVVWLGFFTVAAALAVLFKKGKELFSDTESGAHLIFFSSIFLLAACSVMGGVTFGYPRYHSPAIPLLYGGVALLLTKNDFEKFDLSTLAMFLIPFLLIQLFLIGDPVYMLRYTIREYAALMPRLLPAMLKDSIIKITLACAGYAAIFSVFLRKFSRKTIVGLLVIFSAVSTTMMTCVQSSAGYNTGYNYGERGTAEASEYVRTRMKPGSVIVAPGELIYYMGLINSPRPSFSLNREISADRIKKLLEGDNVSAFVYGITTNTTRQLRIINEDRLLQELLLQNFTHIKVGTYDIWTRSSRLPE